MIMETILKLYSKYNMLNIAQLCNFPKFIVHLEEVDF